MFWPDFPKTKMIRPRILLSFGRDRDLVVFNKPISIPPGQKIHRFSYVFPSPIPGKAMVSEWTERGGTIDHHWVDI